MITLLHIAGFIVINIFTALFGYVLLKQRLLKTSWFVMAAILAVTYLLLRHEHPALLMLAITAVTFTAIKPIPAITDYRQTPIKLTLKQWLTFALTWAGMRAQPFEKLDSAPLPNATQNMRFGISRFMVGFTFVLVACVLKRLLTITPLTYGLLSCLILVGFSFMLHFGLLSISTGKLRKRGVNVGMLFKSPARANSFAEFWGKRWNLAFSEMTSVIIYRPLKKRVGAACALLASFVFSGLLHEVALSLPVNSGYGLPTLYFLLQGILVLVEKKWLQNHLILQNPIIAKVWTICWVVVPAPLLFHARFIQYIIWPVTGLSF